MSTILYCSSTAANCTEESKRWCDAGSAILQGVTCFVHAVRRTPFLSWFLCVLVSVTETSPALRVAADGGDDVDDGDDGIDDY